MDRKLLIIFLVLMTIIFFRYKTSLPDISDGQRVRVSGKVLSEPLSFETTQRITLHGLKIYLPKYPEIIYGDEVIIEGTVEKGFVKDPFLVSHTKSKNFLFRGRERLVLFYQKVLPQEAAALVAGMVLGSKGAISADFWEALKKSGTAHVVVASGMNVTLVASFLISVFLLFLPRTKAIVAAIAGIWLYSLLSGLDAPIVRAAIMGSIAFGAQGLGRVYLAWRGLIASIFIMLLVNPLWIHDLGFVLSVVATASLMLFERKVSRLIQFVPGLFREGFSTSLAAQVGVAPILYVTFGSFNILSPLINALVLWTVPMITVIGGISGILGLLVFDLGRLTSYLIFPLTTWFIYIVKLFS